MDILDSLSSLHVQALRWNIGIDNEDRLVAFPDDSNALYILCVQLTEHSLSEEVSSVDNSDALSAIR